MTEIADFFGYSNQQSKKKTFFPVKDILAHQHRPKPNSTLRASQVSYLY